MDDENKQPEDAATDETDAFADDAPTEGTAGSDGGGGDDAAGEQRTDGLNDRLTALESVVSELSKTVAAMQADARDGLMDGDDTTDATDDEDEDGINLTLDDLMG